MSVCFRKEAGAYFYGINFAATPMNSAMDMASLLMPWAKKGSISEPQAVLHRKMAPIWSQNKRIFQGG